MTLEILTEDRDAALVLSQLALGTLVSIRDGNLPMHAAIWGIAAPVIFAPEAVRKLLPEELRRLLASSDELDIIAELEPAMLPAEIQRYIDALNRYVSETGATSWRLKLRVSSYLEDHDEERTRERRLRRAMEAERGEEGDG